MITALMKKRTVYFAADSYAAKMLAHPRVLPVPLRRLLKARAAHSDSPFTKAQSSTNQVLELSSKSPRAGKMGRGSANVFVTDLALWLTLMHCTSCCLAYSHMRRCHPLQLDCCPAVCYEASNILCCRHVCRAVCQQPCEHEQKPHYCLCDVFCIQRWSLH